MKQKYYLIGLIVILGLILISGCVQKIDKQEIVDKENVTECETDQDCVDIGKCSVGIECACYKGKCRTGYFAE